MTEPKIRYGMRYETDFTWTVFDVATGEPAIVDGVPQKNMELEVAYNLVDRLNLGAQKAEQAIDPAVEDRARREERILKGH